MTKPLNPRLRLDGYEVSDSTRLVNIYQERVKRQGFGGEMMFYKDESQHGAKLRQFATLLRQIIRPEHKVLDAGCGYGSLFPMLPACHYKGIDLVPEFISHALSLYPSANFEVTDIESYCGNYDWCVLLGVVNGIPFPERVIEAAWRGCSEGLIVDFIDAGKFNPPDNFLNRFSMGDCLSDFLELGASSVEVYPTENIWTIFVVNKFDKWVR